MELSEYREELDKLDAELLRLFQRRMEICGEIGAFKTANRLPILDPVREQEKLNWVCARSAEPYKSYSQALFTKIMELSRDYQSSGEYNKRCGLLGEKLGHSYSPQIHSLLAAYSYQLFEKSPEELPEFLRHGDWDGLNVTIPYKKTVLPFCDELSETAQRIGSVNTLVRRPDGSIYGDNTDAYGFRYLLR